MYNLSFLDYLTDNHTIFLFHNETESVEGSIVDGISSVLSPDLKKRCFGRTINESLITLQYPCADSAERTFNQFFDSPRCASMMFSTFKGVFIVDCTRYKVFNAGAIGKLVDYIRENASPDFKFIVLMSQQCKRDAEVYISKSSISNACVVDLELGKSSLDELKGAVCEDDYAYLMEQFDESEEFRKLSLKQIRECITNSADKKQDLRKAISIAIAGNSDERRIGF